MKQEEVVGIVTQFAAEHHYRLVNDAVPFEELAVASQEYIEMIGEANVWCGDIFTIFMESDHKAEVVFKTGFTNKRVLRKLSTMYNLSSIDWEYDQRTAPHWHIGFCIETIEEFHRLLADFQTLVKNDTDHPSEDHPQMIFSVEEACINEKMCTVIKVMEKEDWIHFRTFMREFDHDSRMPAISDIMRQFHIQPHSYYGLYSKLPLEEVRQQIESHPHFTYEEELKHA